MAGHLIGLDKHPGRWPVAVGETCWRMMAKCVIKEAGHEAKEACVTNQLYGGVEAGIEGCIHVMRLLWAQFTQDEDWGFLLIEGSPTCQ